MKLSFFVLSTAILQGQLVPSTQHPQVTIPKDLVISQFADKSQVVNATALCIDSQNRVFVAETHRWRVQVQDIRFGGKNNRYLTERIHDDISIMDRYGRTAFHQKWSGKEPGFLKWEQFDDDAEVIKVLEDTNGDGKADKNTIFRDDFNDKLAGPSGGLIEKDGTVYFSMIPGIYSLRDLDGDGKAEEVKTLVDGFGLRVSFSGHDMNGFAWGPDGKLYWSIGDRGYNVIQNGQSFTRPDSGAIFRSNPDGSEFEVFCHNLRNPKEIVFDEFGNLFTVDNDYDKGDNERIVYLVEHGDSGWKMGHQTIASFSNAAFNHMGPKPPRKEDHLDMWMNEGLWKPRHDRQPAYILPPVANTVDGPCGFAYNPGVTALSDQFKKHFFVASYVAAPDRCGIYSFTLKPDGAGFALDKGDWFMKGIALTDLDWAPDGKLYISDYGGGWGKPEKGGIYTMATPNRINHPKVRQVKELFAEGFPKMNSNKLFGLLEHTDQRVRKRAQFALAERGIKSLSLFQYAIKKDQPLFRRLHGIWGIGQLAQKKPEALKSLSGLFYDSEMEVRANLARTLGNHPAVFQKELIALLKDPSPRVVSLAAIALANHRDESAIQPAIALLHRNADQDAVVRHAAIMILAKTAKDTFLTKLNKHASPAVRRGAVVALRRQKSKLLESFFDDADTSVRQEAIRAAYDENIRETFPALSARAYHLAKNVTPEIKWHPLTARRLMHAAWTLGRPNDLGVIASILNNSAIDHRVRRDALVILLDWNKPPIPDPVTGFVRQLPTNRTPLGKDLMARLKPFFDEGPPKLLPWALKLAKQENLPLSSDHLVKYLNTIEAPEEARVPALQLLANLKNGEASWPATLESLFTDKSNRIRSQARKLLFKTDPNRAISLFKNILTSKETSLLEKQLALKTISGLKSPEAIGMIKSTFAKFANGSIESGLALDVITAAEAAKLTEVTAWRAKLPKEDPLAEWKLLCQTGGDIARGKNVFYSHAAGQCQRCHALNGVGGNVGPELGAIGKSYDEAYLLRALITPGSEVAIGFGMGAITLKDGTTVAGQILVDDKDGNAQVKIGEETITVPKDQIQARTKPVSSMPPMHALMAKQELRDLVAYLRSCKEDKTDDGHK